MKRFAFLLFAGLVFPQSLSAQEKQYQKVIQTLEAFLAEEIRDKNIPALSMALVEDQTLVWSKGFGYQDPTRKTPATPRTVYRVGSVSKPISALLLMILVELGLIDLDAPVQTYLPDFRPKNSSGKAITLRQIVSHKSGLIRESPVGSYFDDTEPTLEQLVASLNGLELVYPPESKLSYSNAAVGMAGLIMERTQKEDFAKLIQRKLLDPIGMTSSGYEIDPKLRKNLAKATMWTYHGRSFPAPPFKMAMTSAGNLYSTVEDQAKLLSFLFAEGKTADGKQLLKPETLKKMFELQLADPKEKAGFGIGWYVSDLDGKKRIGHGGAVYGFATEFAALPGEKLGVIVVCSRDVANGVTRRVADWSLRAMVAARAGKDLPPLERATPLSREEVRKFAGRYKSEKLGFDLIPSGDRLFVLPLHGGMKLEVRQLGKGLMIDDVQSVPQPIEIEGTDLILNKKTYRRAETKKPAPCPEEFLDYLGEYGPDHNTLFILERDGQLNALIESVFLYPLKEIGKDAYQFPDFGLYHGDKVIFHRDAKGKVDKVTAGNVDFARREGPATGQTFQIKPIREIEAIKKEALKASPLKETNALFKKPDLVDVTKLSDTIRLDIRYATDNNFLGVPLYSTGRAFLQRPAAEALVRVHEKLKKKGFGVMIHDAYRPWFVTKIFWEATPPKLRNFVADPVQGSRHNRGCAVDLTLYDLKTGKAVQMVSGYDEFTDRSYADFLGGTSLERWHRDLLRAAMEDEGFTVYPAEWWHFDYRDWRRYPIGNESFEALER